MASALIVRAYSIERVAIPPEVGTCAPILTAFLAFAIWRAYMRVKKFLTAKLE
jgi:hypothetical protein